MADHAILSASAAHRWINCPPSARLEQQFPNETSSYAAEGTFAHALAELKLSRAVANTVKPSTFKKKLTALQKDPFYSPGLEEYVDQYVAQVSEIYLASVAKCKDTLVLLEQRLDFSHWVPGGFGTGDVIIIGDDTLEVIDLKYGKGIPVSAENNPQTRLYGLGAIEAFGTLYDFSKVRMTIIQPRLDIISTEEMSVGDLVYWATNTVMGAAEKAWKGEGEFRPGDHCQFCRIKAACRARAEENLRLTQYDFREPELLTDEEIGDILTRADELMKWVKDIQEYAFDQAYNHGKKYDGWKLVEGRSVRKYIDEAKVAEVLKQAGYSDGDIYKPKELLGITAMEKVTGKNTFYQLLGGLVIKPAGKPTLVPESDKRPEINSTASAAEDFSNVLD
ncbi:MAG: DUF2800 domain-containing protein [Bacillota bacterium]|jgi:hypothetical protein|nr:DUF2800 domain-containing protein [Bacillota bacterium]